MRIRSSRFLTQLLLFSLLLSTIPGMAIGFFSYVRTSETVQDHARSAAMQLLQQTQMNVEQTLKIVDNAVTNLSISPLIVDSLSMDLPAEQYAQIYKAADAIQSLQTYELGINNVHFVNLDRDWAITNRGIARYREIDTKNPYPRYAEINRPSYWISEISNGEEAGVAAVPIVSLVKKLPINAKDTIGLLIAQLPTNQLSKLISRNSRLGETVVLDSLLQPLSITDQAKLASNETIYSIVDRLQQLQANEGDFELRLNGEDAGVMYRRSAYNGWVYLHVVSLTELTKESRTIGLFTFTVCTVILATALLVSLLGSRKMYLPIRSIVHNLSKEQAKQPKEANTDEFRIIREGIQSLQLTRTQLQETLQGHSRQLQEFFVLKLLTGEVRAQDIAEKLEQFGVRESWTRLCVMTVQIDTLDLTRYKERDTDLLMFSINNIAGELLARNRLLQPVVIAQFQVSLYGGHDVTDEAFKQSVSLAAEQIQQHVKDILSLEISIGVSRTFTELKDASQAYKESLEALKYRIRIGHEAIIYLEDVIPDSRLSFVFPEEREKELIDAVKVSDLPHANYLLNRLIQELVKEKRTHQEYQFHWHRLLINLMGAVRESGELHQALFASKDPLYEQLFQLRTAREIEDWFMHTVIKPICIQLENKTETQYKSISAKIMDMIHSEFDTDLTLDECASRLNYHPSYIKTVLRKELESHFSDCLSQYRLQVAKKWLKETDMKVSEIAERLRFNNAQNFIRSFRRMEGMTPGAYRETH